MTVDIGGQISPEDDLWFECPLPPKEDGTEWDVQNDGRDITYAFGQDWLAMGPFG